MTPSRIQRLASVVAASIVLSSIGAASAEPPRAEILSVAEPDADAVDGGPSGLMVGGLATLATFYAAGGIGGLVGLGEYDNTAWALIPIGGPFVAASLVEPKSEYQLAFPEVFRAGFVVAGVGQVIGAAFTFVGLVAPSDDEPSIATFRVAPAAPGADVGLGISGTF